MIIDNKLYKNILSVSYFEYYLNIRKLDVFKQIFVKMYEFSIGTLRHIKIRATFHIDIFTFTLKFLI